MNADDVIALVWKLAAALAVGVPILTTVGVWLVHRFTKPLDAYSKERAKLFAQAHNIEKLIEQTSKLTTTAETIKTELSGEAWLKQQRWSRRFDTYANVIEQLDRYRSATAKYASSLILLRETKGAESDVKAKADKFHEEAAASMNEATAAWIHAKSLAHLCCDSDAVAILNTLEFHREGMTITDDTVRTTHAKICDVTARFNEIARRDVGYEPVTTANAVTA